MAILISLVNLPSVREFRRHVLISFIWERLLSIKAVETVETGSDKPIEAIFCEFGNIATSISFVISSFKLQCNAVFKFLNW